MSFFRAWPIAENKEVLEKRWDALLAVSDRKILFKESRDRKVTREYPALDGISDKMPALSTLLPDAPPPTTRRFAFRSFDRQWAITDPRVGDFLRPVLHQTYGKRQIFLTSLLTEILGEGPAAVTTAYIPDYHHFRGSFGGAHIVPLWRDTGGSKANVTEGVLPLLSETYGRDVTAEDLFAFAYAVLATPSYVRQFWEELRTPGPRLPIPKDNGLFSRLAEIGRELIWLHTFGERFVPAGKKVGRVPDGKARCLTGTPTTPADYPEDYEYDPSRREIRVGKGIFGEVRHDVWEFSISGLQVVESWLGYRMKKRAGKKSSPLDDIRPASWQFDGELLELLWVLDATIDHLPALAALFGELMVAEHLPATVFPVPADAERQGPSPGGRSQGAFTFSRKT